MAEPVENIDEHDLTDIPENPRPQEKDGHDDDPGVGAGEKRWPGWPGENVYRLLVPSQNVGGIIGRGGEFIKKMVEETKARIKVLDGPPGTQERAVMVSAKEEPDVSIPPAIDALLKVHRRLIDSLDGDHAHDLQNADGTITSRLLMAATQAGSLIGKQGSTIKSIQESSHCNVRVLGQEHHLPVFALEDDKVVEVQGDPEGVHKAIELIASHLRKFLVDRSVVGLFLMHMQMPMPKPNSHMEQNMPPYQNWGPPPNAGGGGYRASPHFMPPPRQHDNYYPPADYPPMDKSHQGLSMYGRDYGRDPPMGAHASNNSHPTPSIVTQVTQHMQVPLAYADAVIGNAGSNISYIRRASGATITIQETRGVPGEMTVEINGTASEVQAAQQLIQNFMAEAAAGAPSQNTGGGPTDTGYNSYPPQGSMYSSPPSNAEYAGHNAGHNSGGYGPVYGSNYGYI